MLAAMQGMPYQNHEISFLPDDKIFIYTDGVTEATDSNNRLYGEERLLSALNREEIKNMNTREVLNFLRADIDNFVSDSPQFDDITMLAMKFCGSQDKLKTKNGDKKMNEIKILAADINMEKVNEFIHSCIPEECPPILLNKIDLAVEEIFVNIAHYAYNPEVGEVYISAFLDSDILTVIFKDKGKPFNPIEKKDPDITLSAQERDIGGLGIFLTKKFMDDVEYEYSDGQNILTIKKKLK